VSPLCSRNARPKKDGKGSLLVLLLGGTRTMKGVEVTPVPIPCSRNAHDQNVLVRRPQWDQHGRHSSREKRASLEGIFRRMTVVRCAQGRTVWMLP
jgi:hypothetical protein